MAKNLKFLVPRVLIIFSLIVTAANLAVADETYDVHVRYKSGDYSQVNSLITHKGQLSLQNLERDNEIRSLAFNVDANIKFDQRFTGKTGLLAIRAYDPATHATISISDGKRDNRLTEKNRYIIARVKKQGPVQSASLEDVLNQAESELITNPCDPLSFAKFFDQTGVKVGDQWDVSDEALSTFLSVDRVFENKVRMQLREVKGNQAKVYILGQAKTEVDDATNTIIVSASALIDLETQKLISLRASLQHNREIGQIAPGFEGTTKIDLRMVTKDKIESLANQQIAQRTQSQKIERKLKWHSEKGQFALLYDPRWHIIASEDDGAVLRYLKNGTLLAQCNIAHLASRPANSPLELAAFKREIAALITKQPLARIATSKQHTTKHGLQALHVRVDSTEDGVPITWLYYLVGHDDGRQLTFVFTLEKEIADDFLPADIRLLDSFAFLSDLKISDLKSPAKNRSAEKPNRDSERKR